MLLHPSITTAIPPAWATWDLVPWPLSAVFADGSQKMFLQERGERAVCSGAVQHHSGTGRWVEQDDCISRDWTGRSRQGDAGLKGDSVSRDRGLGTWVGRMPHQGQQGRKQGIPRYPVARYTIGAVQSCSGDGHAQGVSQPYSEGKHSSSS